MWVGWKSYSDTVREVVADRGTYYEVMSAVNGVPWHVYKSLVLADGATEAECWERLRAVLKVMQCG